MHIFLKDIIVFALDKDALLLSSFLFFFVFIIQVSYWDAINSASSSNSLILLINSSLLLLLLNNITSLMINPCAQCFQLFLLVSLQNYWEDADDHEEDH